MRHLHRFISLGAALALLLFVPRVGQAQISWTFIGPPSGPGRIVSVVMDPRGNEVALIAAPGAGIWKTQDSGVTWTPQTDSKSSLQFCSLALDPQMPDVVYAGTGDDQSPRPGQGVMHSSDGGATWSSRVSFTNQPVCAIAVDPTNSSRIAAGSAEGMFISADAG